MAAGSGNGVANLYLPGAADLSLSLSLSLAHTHTPPLNGQGFATTGSGHAQERGPAGLFRLIPAGDEGSVPSHSIQ